MEKFDFEAPAEVFNAGGRMGKRRAMAYLRFQTGAEALQHAMEVLGPDKLGGTTIQSDEARFGAADIRELYDSIEYPLPRVPAAPAQ
jgi:hypothetical protein